MRIRMQITKDGDLRYISHLDFVRMVERALRCGEVPVAYSAGFNPRPKIGYSPALPVGISSETEFVDVWLTMRRDPEAIAHQVGRCLPVGARVLGSREVQDRAPALTAVVTGAGYEVSLQVQSLSRQELEEAVAKLCESDFCGRVSIKSCRGNCAVLKLSVPAGSRRGPKPKEVVADILSGLDMSRVADAPVIHRTELFVGGGEGPPRLLTR